MGKNSDLKTVKLSIWEWKSRGLKEYQTDTGFWKNWTYFK